MPKKHLIFIFVFLALCIAFVGIYRFISQNTFFKINEITCQIKPDIPCSPDLVEWLSESEGSYVFTLKPRKHEQDLLAAFPYFDTAVVTVTFPHRMEVELVYAKPVVAVQNGLQPKVGYTESGYPSPVTDLDTIPLIQIASQIDSQNAIINEDINTIQPAIELVIALEKSAILFQYVTYKDTNTLEVLLLDGYSAIFTPHSDISRQVATLQAILGTATMNPDRPYIDVRFDKPVLKPDISAFDVNASVSAEVEE